MLCCLNGHREAQSVKTSLQKRPLVHSPAARRLSESTCYELFEQILLRFFFFFKSAKETRVSFFSFDSGNTHFVARNISTNKIHRSWP